MAAKALPEQSVLLQLLRYEPETGKLFWRERGVEWFEDSVSRSAAHIMALWNARYAHKEAFTSETQDGYRSGHLLGEGARAHRVIWKMQTGDDPDQVDHVDGVRHNNRWPNLRDVPWGDNAKNHKKRHDNTSGIVGIYRYSHERKNMKWLVRAGPKHIGYFDCIGQAIKARRAAELEHNFHPNHGRTA